MFVAEEGRRVLGAACGEVAAADKAAMSAIRDLTSRTTDHLSGALRDHQCSTGHLPLAILQHQEEFAATLDVAGAGSGASHLESVSTLATHVHHTTSDSYEQDAHQGGSQQCTPAIHHDCPAW